ncbi:hypothetical protein FRC12_003273 [Ceratobasidium sp. 428]|nr:hypothetical protein FRC12_003273 [Ceratobasidium sp. 428]
MSQQKASLLLSKQGKLEVGTRPIPTPRGEQALVKVTAAAINPVDWKIVDYGLFIDEFPAVLGTDGAGIIESVGPDVTGFQKGDKIFFQGLYKPADSANFQQYTLVDTEVTAKVPSNINDDQASTIPLGSVTSLVGLFQKSGVAFPESGPTAAGKSVLILGGSSSVGQFGIQLARIAGFSPIVTTASSQHAEYLKSLGATHVFDRNVDLKTLQEAFAGPVSLAFDSISIPSTQKLAIEALTAPSIAPGAHLALVLPLDAALQKEVEGKVTVNQVFGSSHTWKDLTVPYWQIIGKWIEEGKIVPNHVQLVSGGLSAVPDALDLSRKGESLVQAPYPAIQLARIAGFSPVVTTTSEKHTEYLQPLGATRILNRNADVKALQSAFVEPVSFVLDAISLPETQSVAFEVLTTPNPVPGVHLAVVLKFQTALKAKNEALGSRSVAVNDVWGTSHLYRDITIPFWSVLEVWIKSEKLVPNRV